MKKSYSKIYLHFIWSVKNRQKVLTSEKIELIRGHIFQYAKECGIFVIEINGYLDHFHLLVDMPVVLSPAKVMNLLKGESSNWINSGDIFRHKFAWQKKYSVFSVSHSQRDKIIDYIQKQPTHHRKMSFQEEVEKFFERHGLEFSPSVFE